MHTPLTHIPSTERYRIWTMEMRFPCYSRSWKIHQISLCANIWMGWRASLPGDVAASTPICCTSWDFISLGARSSTLIYHRRRTRVVTHLAKINAIFHPTGWSSPGDRRRFSQAVCVANKGINKMAGGEKDAMRRERGQQQLSGG